MRLCDAVSFACSSLRNAGMRTFLTILGLSVGVGAVLTVLTLGDAGEIRVEQEIAKLGVNKVWIRPRDDHHHLKSDDSSMISAGTNAPACAAAYTAAPVLFEGTAGASQIAGFDEEMEAVHQPKLLDGRMFSQLEYEQGSPVCLIDETMADMFGKDLLGKWISVQNRRFRVVGVIESMTAQMMSFGYGMVVLPMQTYMDTFSGSISDITISVQTGQSAEEVARQALGMLAAADAYRVDTLEKEIAAAREIVRIFVMVLVCVAAVCMVTGGIGVTNVLLISVKERQKEIGLIKAVGGTNKQMGCVFLLEAVIYSVIGSIAGTLLGAVLISIFGAWIGISARMNIRTIVPVLLSTAAIGIIAGVAPAISAAGMEPVDALRRE